MRGVLGEDILERLSADRVAADRQSTQCDTVVRGIPGDEAGALGLRRGDFEEVLSGHFKGSLDCFGSYLYSISLIYPV